MKQGAGKPWERQPGETGPAFEAFSTYRDLGPGRTVAEAARVLSKSRQLLVTWKGKWDWEARVNAYDASVAEEARKKAVKDHKDMETRHIGLAMQLQKKAIEALNLLQPEEMSAKDIKEFVKMATELERLSRSFEEQRTATETGPDGPGQLANAIMAAYKKRRDDGND